MASAHKIFIDGSSGTTGILIRQLLAPLEKTGQISLLSVADHRDLAQRRAAFAQADLSVLCLPDEAARETMDLLGDMQTRVLDASSAHRVEEGWVYGLPELSDAQPDLIGKARCVSNPGCFATGAVSILRPLVKAGALDPQQQTVHLTGVSGYSGGGKKMIALYESGVAGFAQANACIATSLHAPHKHLPEIMKYAGLEKTPVFIPHVVSVPRGMMVYAAFPLSALKAAREEIQGIYEDFYAAPSSKIRLAPLALTDKRLDFSAFSALNVEGSDAAPLDTLEIRVGGWRQGGEGQVAVFALFDNLGKGAATQALQNIRLMLSL